VPEDEEGTEGEDLFEDLDKFFAPIQDVDWPESSEGTGSGTTQAADRSQEPAPAEPKPPEPVQPEREPDAARSSTMAFETQPEDEAEEADALEPDAAQPSGGGELFTAPETPSDAEVVEEQDGVDAFLFEAEAESYDVDEPAGETGSGGYVDLPGDEPEVAELIEETVVVEEAPDIEAVEAAADHFAESVRDEVQVEPEAPVPHPPRRSRSRSSSARRARPRTPRPRAPSGSGRRGSGDRAGRSRPRSRSAPTPNAPDPAATSRRRSSPASCSRAWPSARS
jgi:hypothetical protein